MEKDQRIGKTFAELGDWKMRPGEENWILKVIYEDGSREFILPNDHYAHANEDGSRGYFNPRGDFDEEDVSFAEEEERDFYCNGERVELSKSEINAFEFIGLSNIDFVLSKAWAVKDIPHAKYRP